MTSVSTDVRRGVNVGKAIKVPCRCATGADITLSGEQTIDSIAAVADDRVLVKDQDDATENGIYTVATGSWSRAVDFDGNDDIAQGTLIPVANGTANGNTVWRVTSANPIVVDTDDIDLALAINQLNGVSTFMQTVLDDTTAGAVFTTLGITTFIQTLLDDANSAAALATLAAAGTALANTFSGIQTFGAQARFTKGADIASASPLVLGTDGNYFDVTGTTGFSAITVAAGTLFMLQFDGALTLTHGASLDLPGEANITTAAGDRLIGFAEAANTVQVVSYFKADGTALAAGLALPAPDFESAELTVTADTLITSAHSIGAKPTLVQVFARCKTDDIGYAAAAAEEVLVGPMAGGGADLGVTISQDATNVYIVQGSTPIYFHDKGTFNRSAGTAGNWKWIIRAWA